MERQITPPKRVTSSIWGTPPACKQALKFVFRKLDLKFPRAPKFRSKYICILDCVIKW